MPGFPRHAQSLGASRRRAGLPASANLDILIHSLPLPQPAGLPVWFAAAPRLQLWLKDESLEDSANLPDPDVLAREIVEDLQAALAQFAEIAADLKR